MKIPIIQAALVLLPPLTVFAVMHAQQTAQETQRYLQFENDDVKVWKTEVLPNAPLALHPDEHPRVIIALRGGTMNLVEQNGPTEREVWETGKAYWLPANPPGTLHQDVNVGDKPIEVMVVELEKEQ
jgi:beta-alanine degradation protein BauB